MTNINLDLKKKAEYVTQMYKLEIKSSTGQYSNTFTPGLNVSVQPHQQGMWVELWELLYSHLAAAALHIAVLLVGAHLAGLGKVK